MLAPASTPSRPFPGSALLHPLVVGAVAALIVNDHFLKALWPSWWTGKLSDLAGLVMFPLVLQALWEHVGGRGARSFRASRVVLVSCVLLTGLCFSATKVSELAGEGWQWGLGLLQWPIRSVGALLAGGPLPSVLPVAHVVDVTDLVTLPALLVSLALGWRRCDGRVHPPPACASQGTQVRLTHAGESVFRQNGMHSASVEQRTA